MISFKTPYLPSEVGYDSERLEVLNRHFAKMLEANELQSANYCLSRDGKIFANTAMGKLSYKEEDERPVQPDTIQNIASVTKLFCASAIFKLVEDGRLRLDQCVGEFIEEFKAPPFNKINLAHLLTHTSGMMPDPGCFDNKYFKSPWEFVRQMKGTNWIEAALASGMRKQPGEEWAYCSFGFAILGEVISRVSGTFANDYIMENIVRPCGMEDTFFDLTAETAVRHAVRNPQMEKEIDSILAGKTKAKDSWSKIPSTGGGLHSTALDLCKLGTMLLNKGTYDGKRILGRKAVEKMTALHTTPDVKDYCWNAGGVSREYGLGPDMRHNLASLYTKGTFFHEGAGGCCILIDPVEKLVAAWFVPFVNNVWRAHALYNAAAVMWSGLE